MTRRAASTSTKPNTRNVAKSDAAAKSQTSRHFASKTATRKVSSKDARRASERDDEGEHEHEPEGDEDEDEADAYSDSDDSDARSLHSDALDDDDGSDAAPMPKKQKRKRASKATPSSANASPRKGLRKNAPRKRPRRDADPEEDSDEELELKAGQQIVGTVVQAPKTGRVPPGQISRNTFDFLTQLRKPECNDREWFRLHEPVYRLAESEWKAFVEAFTPLLVAHDPQIPHLPPKDVIHRIYRDIRFSNDKTPYKMGFSASFSRSGRKGIFAHYHVAIQPGGGSLIAAGAWCPERNELATIRNNLLRSSTRLRRVLAAPAFVKLFGEPTPHPAGARQSIFGGEDELKVAPKGVEKTHKDIDLLKCRSFAVVHYFKDAEVLAPDFMERLCGIVDVVRPFVHCINDLMTLQDGGSDDEDEDEAEGGEEDEDEED